MCIHACAWISEHVYMIPSWVGYINMYHVCFTLLNVGVYHVSKMWTFEYKYMWVCICVNWSLSFVISVYVSEDGVIVLIVSMLICMFKWRAGWGIWMDIFESPWVNPWACYAIEWMCQCAHSDCIYICVNL